MLILILCHPWRWTSSISGMNQRGTMKDFYKGLHTFTTFQYLQYIVCLATLSIITAKLCKIVPLTQYLQSLHLQMNRISRGKKYYCFPSHISLKCWNTSAAVSRDAALESLWDDCAEPLQVPCLSHPLWANAKWEKWTHF